METEIKYIDNLCVKITDGSHFSPEDDEKGQYPMYSVKDMEYNSFSNQDCKHIGQDVFDKLSRQDCRPLKDDIVIAKDGSYLKYVFKVKEDLDACILSSIAILRPNKKVIDPDYFVYLMRSASVKNAMANYVSGSALPRIILSDFKKMKIAICSDLNKQKHIASILSAYDSQIENNQKRIKLLEQMAENLYKEWFVRFRFPGYEKERMESSKFGRIPISFDVKTMGEVFEYYIGGGWGEEQQSQDFPIEASVIRGADFPNVWHFDIASCPRRYHKISNYKSRQLEPGDIVFEISGGTSEQPVGRAVLATKELIDRFQDKHVICASFCKLIRIKKDVATPYYFYYWLKYLYDTRIIDRFQLQSTGIINFKFESFLKKGTVVLPPMDIMKQFDDSVEHLYCEMNNLAKQNDILSHQRDLLLPRLMSGKLSI